MIQNMVLSRKDIEIMAPVGSFESLMAAIQGGANSIYFGVEKLNMRARSSNNFTLADLQKIVAICKENNVKTYLTLNIVVYNNEISLVETIVKEAKVNGIDAVIATDFAVLNACKRNNVNVHISTQCNISNIEAVKFYACFADVVVLARELDITQVKEIYTEIANQNIVGPSGNLIRIEMFAHGALCMSISGKCYLSLHETNFSANRGACLQTCRRGYTVTDNETQRELAVDHEYIMSPKDLCTIGFLDKLIDSGVRILKIEGRARSPEYVKTVCKAYSEALDYHLSGNYSIELGKELEQKLQRVFNRGFWDGYYLGQRLGEWSDVYGSKATTRKVYVGKCMNYFSKLGVAEFLIESDEISVGDEVIISGATTGIVEQTIEEIRVDLKSVNLSVKGEKCSIPVKQIIRRSDKLYKVVGVGDFIS